MTLSQYTHTWYLDFNPPSVCSYRGQRGVTRNPDCDRAMSAELLKRRSGSPQAQPGQTHRSAYGPHLGTVMGWDEAVVLPVLQLAAQGVASTACIRRPVS